MINAKGYLQAWLALLAAAAMIAAVPATSGETPLPVEAQASQNPEPQLNPGEAAPSAPPLSEKQKENLLKYNFKEMKKEAQELSTLAKSLQEDLEHSNENVLSLGVVSKAEKIEKLAKKIKDTAKGLPDRAGRLPETGAGPAK
jgi:hypothetical protein